MYGTMILALDYWSVLIHICCCFMHWSVTYVLCLNS